MNLNSLGPKLYSDYGKIKGTRANFRNSKLLYLYKVKNKNIFLNCLKWGGSYLSRENRKALDNRNKKFFLFNFLNYKNKYNSEASSFFYMKKKNNNTRSIRKISIIKSNFFFYSINKFFIYFFFKIITGKQIINNKLLYKDTLLFTKIFNKNSNFFSSLYPFHFSHRNSNFFFQTFFFFLNFLPLREKIFKNLTFFKNKTSISFPKNYVFYSQYANTPKIGSFDQLRLDKKNKIKKNFFFLNILNKFFSKKRLKFKNKTIKNFFFKLWFSKYLSYSRVFDLTFSRGKPFSSYYLFLIKSFDGVSVPFVKLTETSDHLEEEYFFNLFKILNFNIQRVLKKFKNLNNLSIVNLISHSQNKFYDDPLIYKTKTYYFFNFQSKALKILSTLGSSLFKKNNKISELKLSNSFLFNFKKISFSENFLYKKNVYSFFSPFYLSKIECFLFILNNPLLVKRTLHFFKSFFIFPTFEYLKNFFYSFYSYNGLMGTKASPLCTNIVPTKNSFLFQFKRHFLQSFNYRKFDAQLAPHYYHYLIKFLEFCSGKKVYLQLNSFIILSLTEDEKTQCFIWSQRIKLFRKILGPRLFLNESLQILWICLKLKDPYLLSNWMLHMFYKISFWKYKMLFRYMQYILRYFFWPLFDKIKVKGLKFQLKGKVSVAGNARKRTVRYKIGSTGHASFNNRVLTNLNLLRTFTGVIGFRTWLIF